MKRALLLFLFTMLLPHKSLADDKDVIAQVYNVTTQYYVEPVSVGDIALLSIKQIHLLDDSITIADDAKRVSIYKDTLSFKSYLKPEPDNLKEWVLLTEKVMKEVRRHSPKFKERDYDRLDVMFEGAFNELDDSSKYYSDDYAEEHKDNNHRYFYAKNLKEDILYIKLKNFNENIKQSVVDSIRAYHQGMILDLRGNKGGMLNEAIEVAKLFLDGGIIGVSKDRGAVAANFYMSDDGDVFAGRPMVVLVDAGTASSAEVLTAALQEQGRAKVLGTQTYGKGTIQTMYSLPKGYLALSTAYLFTPSNKTINKKGVIPDVCTSNVIIMNDKSPCPREERENVGDDIDSAVEVILSSVRVDS